MVLLYLDRIRRRIIAANLSERAGSDDTDMECPRGSPGIAPTRPRPSRRRWCHRRRGRLRSFSARAPTPRRKAPRQSLHPRSTYTTSPADEDHDWLAQPNSRLCQYWPNPVYALRAMLEAHDDWGGRTGHLTTLSGAGGRSRSLPTIAPRAMPSLAA